LSDPRIHIIEDRLSSIKSVVAVSSGKGGVGKSLIASTSALILAKKGRKVGLLDLDFTNPSTHVILGAESAMPIEDRGIIPPKIHGVEYLSIIYYSRDKPAPLRGEDASNILLEILSITRWSRLDHLIIDMPPGIGDAFLDIIRFIKRMKFLIVTTSSKLAFETIRKLIILLLDLGMPIIGLIENMKISETPSIREYMKDYPVRFLGEIPLDLKLEEALGDVEKLLKTRFAVKLEEIIETLMRRGLI